MRNTPEQGGSVTGITRKLDRPEDLTDKERELQVRVALANLNGSDEGAAAAVRAAEEEVDPFEEDVDPYAECMWDDPDSLDWEPEPIIVERPGPASLVRVPTNYRAAIRQARAERRAA
jgi:hypothetical protein